MDRIDCLASTHRPHRCLYTILSRPGRIENVRPVTRRPQPPG
ncbi:hypothetical protein HSB1_40840 [Halogranum salarium B-1]|uniref:Uncharacterized protein n=1 Tax=Halogranum salarium B-1 TaxID=1210908 RepID=J2ZXI2_9EURY|nr:hypothetical protein HSB1_40840 [Halogranum salarium B-1]